MDGWMYFAIIVGLYALVGVGLFIEHRRAVAYAKRISKAGK